MNKCPKCGTKGEVMFCPECGTKMIGDDAHLKTDQNNKVCPKCGYEGNCEFCPECGSKMEDSPSDEDRKNKIFDEAVKKLEETNSESYRQAISDLEGIGDWRDADRLIEKAKEKLEEIEQKEAEEKAEKERESVYEGALRKFEKKTIKDHRSGIADLEKIGYWKDAADIVEERKSELAEMEEEKKKKRKKVIKIVGIAAAAIVLVCVAISVISNALKDDLDHDLDSMKDAEINSLKYQYPGSWKEEETDLESVNDVKPHRYVRYNKDDGTAIGFMDVLYVGEDVMEFTPEQKMHFDGSEKESKTLNVGDSTFDITEYKVKAADAIESGGNSDVTVYAAVFEKDYSSYLAYIAVLNDYYDAGFCDEIMKTFKIDEYKNPRTAKSLDIKYTGEKKPGTEIKSSDENVTVTVKYDDGSSLTAEKWELDKDITLEEGKTSEATISCHGLEGKLKVAGRKPVKLTASYSGDTEAGTVIDQGSEDITVEVEYDTGEKEKVTDWKIEKKVELKAGDTSTVKISANGLTCDMKVECTTLSESQYKDKCETRNYKNQLRDESYDEYIKIYGKVLQDCGLSYYRISSSGAYGDVYMVYAPNSDIVEDDWCTVYGQTGGIYSYETVMGATQKVPKINAKYVDR